MLGGSEEPASFASVQGYLVAGNLDDAEAELARAKAAGLPPEAADELAGHIGESRGSLLPLLKKFGWLTLAWVGAFVLLWLVGGGLSKWALRAVDVAMKGEVTPVSSGERRIRRLYRAAVAITGAYFFLSLPIIAAVTLLSAILVVVLCLSAGVIPVKLIAIVGIVALVSVWSIGKSMIALFRYKESDPGEELDLGREPALADVLRRVADDVKTRSVDRVFVTQGTEMAVYERGGPVTTLRGRGERCLILGVAILEGFRVRTFKSILAHEYGHFKNEDTAGGHLALAVRRSIFHMACGMIEGGAASSLNPAWWFIRGYSRVFHRITQGASRLQEVLADRASVFTYGSASFDAGFRHVIAREAAFGLHAKATVDEAHKSQVAVMNFYQFSPSAGPSAEDVESKIAAELSAEHSEDDSHPPPLARLDMAARMRSEGLPPSDADDQEVWTLFRDREALELRMTARIRDAVLENHGVDLAAPKASTE